MISVFAFSTFTPYPIAIYSIIYQSIITESPDLKVDLILICLISLIFSFVDVYQSNSTHGFPSIFQATSSWVTLLLFCVSLQ